MAEAVAISVVDKLLEALIAPIGRQLGYVFFYNGNVKNLLTRADLLEAKKNAVELLVEAGKNNSEVVGPDVVLWLKRVDEEKEAADFILAGTEKVGKGCFNQWCLHLKSRYQLSRKASKFTQALHSLLEEGNFARVSYPPPSLARVPSLMPGDEPDLALSADSSKGAHSRFVVAGDVIKALKDDQVWMIGVCGMGGVGKTTLVGEVSEWAKRERMFDEIVKVVVSKDADLKKVQREIAELLQLTFFEESLPARADRLRDRLAQNGSNGQSKRILVVLDDLWKRLDLKEVGIPFGEHHKGCKILLTSRNKNVFLEMRADMIVALQPFSLEESWSLFKTSLGDTAHLYPEADSIVKECAGLPLALTTIAMALIGKEESTWKYVHNQLKRSVPEEEYNTVYTTLQLSYDFIEKEEMKRLFLLCSIFPEDAEIPIEELVWHTVGLSIVKKPNHLHEEREKIAFYIEKLINSNLLLSSEEKGCVRMHDLVRDFGVSISEQFIIRFSGDVIKTWPIEEIDENLTAISLQCSEITDELPRGLKYNKLKVLRLTFLSELEFSESFFDGMSQLQVLYCRDVLISKLPGSVELLLNLRTLSLTNCAIQFDVSILSKLHSLEILSFARSGITTLPKEIGNLSRLRLLDLTGCRELKIIASGVLSSLVRLEELYLRCEGFFWSEYYYFCGLEYDEEAQYVKDNSSIHELNKLPNLAVFDGLFFMPTLATKLTFLQALKRFRIYDFLNTSSSEHDYTFCNTLYFDSVGNKKCKDLGVDSFFKALFGRTEDFMLSNMDVKFLVDGFDGSGGGYTQLRSFVLKYCTGVLYIFGHFDNPNLYANLESVTISSMDDIEYIFSGQSLMISQSSSLNQDQSFAKLRTLDVTNCNGMKSMCPISVARGLKELTRLTLADCSSMVEVFTMDKEDTNKIYNAPCEIVLPAMISLVLKGLDKLIRFSNSIEEVELPLLQNLELDGLPMITSLYSNNKGILHSKDAASQNHSLFKSFMISQSSSLNQDQSFAKLRTLDVTNCNGMESLCPISVARGLKELTSLTLADCSSMVEVFTMDKEDTNKIYSEPAEIVFPAMKALVLKGLNKLIGFSNSIEKVKLPILQHLELDGLWMITSVYSNEGTLHNKDATSRNHSLFKEVNLPCLTKLILKHMNMETIFDLQTPEAYPQLTWLQLEELPLLECVWSNGHKDIVYWPAPGIEVLEVKDCDHLLHLFNMGENVESTEQVEEKESEESEIVNEVEIDWDKWYNYREEVKVEVEEEMKDEEKHVLLPRLSSLQLKCLPNLCSITPKDYKVNWSSIDDLYMTDDIEHLAPKNCKKWPLRQWYDLGY